MTGASAEETARAAWVAMSELVLDNERRRRISDAVGLPFSRVRALRRLVPAPMTLGELAAAMGVDPPNCTAIVDDLEKQGLVARRPHPTDGRSKLVVVTPAGARVARKALRLFEAPPAGFDDLTPEDIHTLAEILARVGRSEPG